MPLPTKPLLRILALATLLAGGQAAARWYVVRPGDTLSEVAARSGVGARVIAQANGLADPDRLRIGQRLQIPVAGAAVAAAVSHVVRRGESLGAIAARYHTTVAELARANGIVDVNRVIEGAALRVAGPAATPAAPGGSAARPAVFVVPAVSAGTSATHVVRRGETLDLIARRYHTSVSELAKANALRNPNRIVDGAQLAVPSSWRCPVPGARFTNDWGLPRPGGRVHEGNDLLALRGTPVLAPVAGVVEQSTGSIGGRQVRLRGTDGVTYLGSHLERFGDAGTVVAGAVLGYVGNSGDAAGGPTHLHFEIHLGNGRAVNPYPTLVAAGCRG